MTTEPIIDRTRLRLLLSEQVSEQSLLLDEALREEPSRAYLEAYSSRLLKRAAQIYALTRAPLSEDLRPPWQAERSTSRHSSASSPAGAVSEELRCPPPAGEAQEGVMPPPGRFSAAIREVLTPIMRDNDAT